MLLLWSTSRPLVTSFDRVSCFRLILKACHRWKCWSTVCFLDRVAQYQFFLINSISIILFSFLSIPISISINIKRAYQYQCVINYWKVPLSISISMSINWLPYQYQYQYFNSSQNLLKSVHVWNLCMFKARQRSLDS